ncbi:MAG: hypothetical protein DIU54_011365 [Acidobacteriota bacterium]|jgi:hypothetical protein|nr:MAG: hypothetical protein DIU54_12210 [Acidobacteriota bacterium]
MRTKRPAAAICLVVALLLPVLAAAQPQPVPRLRVYLGACDCFDDFMRDRIGWVDFVRQPQDADVQVIGTTVETGAGGIERTLRFVGAGRFADVDFTLRAATPPGETDDGRRRAALDVLHVGLLSIAARDGLPDGVALQIDGADRDAEADAPASDPWNLWVFEVGGNGSFEAEQRSREMSWEIEVEADRVTHDWLLNFRADVEYEFESFDIDDEDDGGRTVEVTTRERAARLFLARSLGSHWSAGFDSTIQASTFENLGLQAVVMPAVEYNVFPYADYAMRQLRIEYAVGLLYARYNEVTIFDRVRETRPRHALSATLEQRQPWGTIESRLEWSQYLDEPGLSRLEFDGEVSLRLVRGLSLDIGGSASRIRDQISLPRRGATPEEVLLRVRELQSGYDVRLFAGLSYSFGSIYNNIVNPRFGRN